MASSDIHAIHPNSMEDSHILSNQTSLGCLCCHPDDFQALGLVHDDEDRTNVQINIAGEACELIAVAARRRGMMTEVGTSNQQ